MNWFRRGRALLADPTWRYPILFGLLTVPFTVAQQVRGDEFISLSSLLWAALLAGYMAGTRPGTSKHVGARTVLVGAIPMPLLLAEPVVYFATAGSSPPPLRAAVLLVYFALAVVTMLFVLAVLGMVAAKIGGRLAERTGRRRDPPVSAA